MKLHIDSDQIQQQRTSGAIRSQNQYIHSCTYSFARPQQAFPAADV